MAARPLTLQWLSADQLRLRRPARPWRLLPPVVVLALWAGAVWWVGPMSGLGLALLTVGGVLLPTVWVKSFRAYRAVSHVLVRAQGRLMLDGEPLEAARVELRVSTHAVLRSPSGYALSVWALVGQADPVELDLGRYDSVLEASQVSGVLEAFLERARQRTPGRLPTAD